MSTRGGGWCSISLCRVKNITEGYNTLTHPSQAHPSQPILYALPGVSLPLRAMMKKIVWLVGGAEQLKRFHGVFVDWVSGSREYEEPFLLWMPCFTSIIHTMERFDNVLLCGGLCL